MRWTITFSHDGSGDCGSWARNPRAEDPRSSNRFSALDRDSDTDTSDNSWEGTSSESETESLSDPEFRGDERRTVAQWNFSLQGDFWAAFESLDELDLNSIFESGRTS